MIAQQLGSNWNAIVNGSVLNKMGVKFFSDGFIYWIGRKYTLFHWNRGTDNENEVRMSKDLEYPQFGRFSLFFDSIFCHCCCLFRCFVLFWFLFSFVVVVRFLLCSLTRYFHSFDTVKMAHTHKHNAAHDNHPSSAYNGDVNVCECREKCKILQQLLSPKM